MNKKVVWATWWLALLVAVAAWQGITNPRMIYARETAHWRVQALAQDWVNLMLIAPWLALSGYFVRRGFVLGRVLWLGGLIANLYTFVMYAFFVHFGPMFPVYVAVLGTNFYVLAGGLYGWIRMAGVGSRRPKPSRRVAGVTLVIIGVLSGGLWNSEIGASLAGGT